MKRTAALACVVASLWACGGGSDAGGGATSQKAVAEANRGQVCGARSGAYTVEYTEKNGTCGHLDSQVVVLTTGEPDGCRGTTQVSADECQVTLDQTCVDRRSGLEEHVAGSVTWTVDGLHAAGTATISATTAGGDSCHGTYDVTYTKN